jgi:ribosomal protein S5
MNGYVAFYAGKQTEVRAASLYAAKLAAVAFFKPRSSQEHMVHVHLAERADGSAVLQSTCI